MRSGAGARWKRAAGLSPAAAEHRVPTIDRCPQLNLFHFALKMIWPTYQNTNNDLLRDVIQKIQSIVDNYDLYILSSLS
jgi:hypothetical protein